MNMQVISLKNYLNCRCITNGDVVAEWIAHVTLNALVVGSNLSPAS